MDALNGQEFVHQRAETLRYMNGNVCQLGGGTGRGLGQPMAVSIGAWYAGGRFNGPFDAVGNVKVFSLERMNFHAGVSTPELSSKQVRPLVRRVGRGEV